MAHNIIQDERLADVERTMKEFNYEPHGLVEVLIKAQETFGYLNKDLLTYVAERLGVPVSKVYGVATFYDRFSFEPVGETHAMICTGPVCAVAGARHVLAETRRLQAGQKGSVVEATCLGLCDQAPAALVNGRAQVNVSVGQVAAMLRQEASPSHLQVTGDPRILTGPIGRLDPLDLAAHRAEGTFDALEMALTGMTPEQVIREVKDSRLAGRGGAGFQTGLKWQFAREAAGTPKYVVCNFDESEPGTFKDRIMMEGNPFRVIEGLVLSAYATGAASGFIYIRGEYPEATEVIEDALDILYDANLLGDGILGTDFNFDVEVRHNAGAYICGEETALFESIEGKRGHPRLKPPYPTQSGLFGKPTTINNVETLAVVPSLILNSGEWFTQWGRGQSVGLKLFCLSGHVGQPGVVEAPFGLRVNEMIEQYGGGFDGDPQAILIGGAAGGFLYPDKFDTPVTHETLCEYNVPVGSGAMMVFNQSTDLWDVLEGLAHFFVHETCGKCAPCRLGTQQIHAMLSRINAGSEDPNTLQKLEQLGQTIRSSCSCGLGMTAANPLLTVLDHMQPAA